MDQAVDPGGTSVLGIHGKKTSVAHLVDNDRDGELDRPLTIVADKFSQSAQDKITAAGGSFESSKG